MSKNERTSASIASKASKVLRDPNASPEAKSVAASALTQAPDRGTDGPNRRLSPEGPSSETTTMTKTTKPAEDAAKDTKEADKAAEQSREVQKDTVNPDAPVGDVSQDQGAEAKGPGQDSGETVKEIDKDDLRGEPEHYLDAKDNEDVVLTEHDPATDPDEPLAQKLEKDQLHQEDDGRIRTGEGKVAWAPPGSYDAAKNGVQQDASGHFSSANLPAGARVK